jgi:hypothetical protein
MRKLDAIYARPLGGFPQPGAQQWPQHTFNRRFFFSAEKYLSTVFKINRVAEMIDGARRDIKDVRPGEVPIEELAKHMGALNDLPIHLETLIVYLRSMADTLANLTPHLYGQSGKNIPNERFRSQRDWFIDKRPNFDPDFATIMEQQTRWFDALAGKPGRMGLRDAMIHYRGGIQLMYRPSRTTEPAEIFASLFSDSNALTHDLFSDLKLIVTDLFHYLDRFTAHFTALANQRTNFLAFDLSTSASTLLFVYEESLPSAWLFPAISSPIT